MQGNISGGSWWLARALLTMNKSNKMKKIIMLATLLATISVAMAIIITPFQGWDWLEEKSSDIVIARCSETPLQIYGGGLVNAHIEVTDVLKGTNSLKSAFLVSQFQPSQGEDYLIFGNCSGQTYEAVEKYRVIPLGLNLMGVPMNSYIITNLIAGKPLDEQIQILLKRRLDNLNRQMQEEQEEKQRLEEGLKK